MDFGLIQTIYDTYKDLLFGDTIPDSGLVRFVECDMEGVMGYSQYIGEPDCYSELAVTDAYELSILQISSIVVHEMIHIWQTYHVSDERYRICSNEIAHDRVFTSKMMAINAILEREGCGFLIDVTMNDTLTKKENK